MGMLASTIICHACGYFHREVIIGWGSPSHEYGRRPILKFETGFLSDVSPESDIEQAVRQVGDLHDDVPF